MKLLITGGAGYIGSHTTHLLAGRGHRIVVLDNLVFGHREAIVDSGVELVNGDIADRGLLEKLFSSYRFDAVIHFAAFAYVGESVHEPLRYYQNNLAAPLNLLEAMRDNGCQKFVLSSTCATYGEPTTIPITEAEPQFPVNPYGHSKRMLEQVLADCETAFGLRSVCLRYFNACGAAMDGTLGEDHDPETHLIPLVLMAAKGTIPEVRVFGADYPTPDGTCIRDYIHVDDLATAHAAALDLLASGGDSLRCNLGTGTGTSVKEIISTVEQVTGKFVPVTYEERRPGDPAVLVADPSLARERLGWVAQHSAPVTAIASAWRWMQKGGFAP
jgi:UDP-glucose 4-epimerase